MHNPFEESGAPDPAPKRESPSKGKNTALEQGTNVPQGWKPTEAKPLPATRCIAPVRNGERKGEQCGAWAPPGSTVCNTHGYQLPSVKEAAAKRVEDARQKLMGLTPTAMDVVEHLMLTASQEGVKLKAALEILDRSGIIKQAPDLQVEVNHNVSHADEIQKRIATIAERLSPPKEEDEENLEDLGETIDSDAETA